MLVSNTSITEYLYSFTAAMSTSFFFFFKTAVVKKCDKLSNKLPGSGGPNFRRIFNAFTGSVATPVVVYTCLN